MAWKRVQVRTGPSAAFEKMSDEVIDYIKTNYDDTGKRTSFSVSSSDDGLVLTYTSIYRDEKLDLSKKYIDYKLENQKEDSSRFITLYKFKRSN